MSDEELQALVKQVSIEFFHRPFHHRALFNSRLRTTGGRYLLSTHNLEFNARQLEYFGMEAFIKIIKHELCHYHLHLSRMGYRHRDRDFQTLLKLVGGSRFCGAIPDTRNTSGNRYTYKCMSCGVSFIRKRKIDTNRYVCGACGGKIRLINKERIK
ncbi:SprT family protein [Sporolactobacillus kofuensis]|uniref:Protein SprT-like n=1 Tax=Sporolactobacillus kofuensis TaxID=269672 RepID=A0ABW1WHI8_9BACL|nr:SprT family protein [Sporolactobacillus kofuensis]MCO7177164.1 SprT family protein [Sporolactobacillus kofuensis]